MGCPLLFTIRERVSGNGFLADVAAHGRALAVRESEGVWIYGVNPGGIAGSGKNETEAYVEFRKAFVSAVFDIAEDSEEFSEFKREVQAFFNDTNRPTENDWLAAVQEARAGKIIAEGIPKQPAESPRYVEVELKEHFSADDNIIEPKPAAAA